MRSSKLWYIHTIKYHAACKTNAVKLDILAHKSNNNAEWKQNVRIYQQKEKETEKSNFWLKESK